MKRLRSPAVFAAAAIFLSSFDSIAEVKKGNRAMTIDNTETKIKHTNRLINESSPYLLQHAHNPVDWYPWGEEALEKSRSEDKPIFLSIGYAACHWCHVMEEESFENEEVAQVLNEHFIPIKVDREQRPDLDQIYMAATQAMTGSGGWPMSVFLTPDLKPFFAGTYFPPEDRYGRPGFKRLITEIARLYKDERQRLEDIAGSAVTALNNSLKGTDSAVALDMTVITKAVAGLMNNYDRCNGGFGGAPKFPHPTDLSFLLKIAVIENDDEILKAVEHSLNAMARGGIYDHLGGGFHRYATDAEWLIPHFEKMLYDNALLTVTYSEAYQVTGNERYRKIVRETLDFILSEMTDHEGGFYSSLDADSEGEEGKYYVWKKDEITHLLGDKAELFIKFYNTTDAGNFENQTSILNINDNSDSFKDGLGLSDDEFYRGLDESRRILLNERQKRPRPFTDDKIMTSWNGLMISGMAWGYKITRDEKYLQAAVRSATFIKNKMYNDGRLVHSYRQGKFSSGQFLEDYAYLIQGLIDLYEVSHDFEWAEWALVLSDQAATTFADDDGHLYLTPSGETDHFMRPRDIFDGALPAPGSVFITALARLADISGRADLSRYADNFLKALSNYIADTPPALTTSVSAWHYLATEPTQVVVIGKQNREKYLDEIYGCYLPNSILVVSDTGTEPLSLLEGKKADDKTRVYLCRNFTCRIPADSPEMLKEQLSGW